MLSKRFFLCYGILSKFAYKLGIIPGYLDGRKHVTIQASIRRTQRVYTLVHCSAVGGVFNLFKFKWEENVNMYNLTLALALGVLLLLQAYFILLFLYDDISRLLNGFLDFLLQTDRTNISRR